MGLILDTSILVADERGKFDMPGFFSHCASPQPLITALTASELLHGVERAQDPSSPQPAPATRRANPRFDFRATLRLE